MPESRIDSPITTLFVDIGNVLLTDSWGPSMRQRAVEQFGFDFAEAAPRSIQKVMEENEHDKEILV